MSLTPIPMDSAIVDKLQRVIRRDFPSMEVSPISVGVLIEHVLSGEVDVTRDINA